MGGSPMSTPATLRASPSCWKPPSDPSTEVIPPCSYHSSPTTHQAFWNGGALPSAASVYKAGLLSGPEIRAVLRSPWGPNPEPQGRG